MAVEHADHAGAMLAWAREALGDVDVTSSLDSEADGVCVRAIGFDPGRNADPDHAGSVLAFDVLYLVMGTGASSVDPVITLLAAARHRPDWQVDLDPPTPQMWLALGVSPRPAIVVHVPTSLPSRAATSKRVVGGLRTSITEMQPLAGRLVGPGGIGIPAARVELVGQPGAATTDGSGHFRFVGAPVSDKETAVRIVAKGKSLTARARFQTSQTTVIRCDLEEV